MLHKKQKITTENEDYQLDPKISENKQPNKLFGFVLENSVWRVLCRNPENFVTLFGKPGRLVRHERSEDKYDFKIVFDDGSIYYFDVKSRSPGAITFTVSEEEYPKWKQLKRENENNKFFVICLLQIEMRTAGEIEGMWEIEDCVIHWGENYDSYMLYLPNAESMI